MKIRIISFLLILLLLPTMVVPAAAADNMQNNFLQVMDYPNPSGATIDSSNTSVTFNLPNWNTLYYLDTLLIMAGDVPTSVTCSFSGHTFDLNILPIDPSFGLYRVYGNLPGYSTDSFILTFSSPGTTWVTFKSIEVATVSVNSFSTTANMSGTLDSGNFTLNYSPGGEMVSHLTYYNNGDIETDDFYTFAYIPEWRKYDYIDLILSFTVGEIASVDVGLSDGSYNLPFTVNFIQDTSTLPTTQMVSVRVDLTGIDRTSAADLQVFVSGALGYGVNAFSIFGCVGHVAFDNDPYIYYFQSIINFFGNIAGKLDSLSANISQWISSQTTSLVNWLTSIRDSVVTWGQNIVSAINPSPDAGQDAVDQGAQQGSTITDLNDQMNALDKPALNGGGDISGIISPGQLTSHTTFLATVVNAPYISSVVMLSLILSLAAYVLFGKR